MLIINFNVDKRIFWDKEKCFDFYLQNNSAKQPASEHMCFQIQRVVTQRNELEVYPASESQRAVKRSKKTR